MKSFPEEVEAVAIPAFKRITLPLEALVEVPGISQRFEDTDDADDIQKLSEGLESGACSPVRVRVLEGYPEQYYLVNGFRRKKAAALLGWTEMEVVVEPASTLKQAKEDWIRDNAITGKPLTNEEKAKCAYELLMDGKTIFQLAGLLGITTRSAKMYHIGFEYKQYFFEQTGKQVNLAPAYFEEMSKAPKKYWVQLANAQMLREIKGIPWRIHGKKPELRAVVSNLTDLRVPKEFRKLLLAGDVTPMQFNEQGEYIPEMGNVANEIHRLTKLTQTDTPVKALEKFERAISALMDQPVEFYHNGIDNTILQEYTSRVEKYITFLRSISTPPAQQLPLKSVLSLVKG